MSTVRERYAPKIKNTAYLSFPLKTDIRITEGYIYSQEERDIHGNYYHKGIDFAAPYGTPVYASASGYAVASYHRFVITNRDLSLRLYNGKPLGNGYGYFVQIYHPEDVCGVKGGRITQYGHLSKVNGIKIKKFKPQIIDWKEEIIRRNNRFKKNKKDFDELARLISTNLSFSKQYPWIDELYGFHFSKDVKEKESYSYSFDEVVSLFKEKDPFVTWVDEGDLIGFVGSSGIVNGDIKYKENLSNPNIKQFDIWDEPHLHFEEASRNEKGKKILQRDPFNIYLSYIHYTNPDLKNTLWKDMYMERLW